MKYKYLMLRTKSDVGAYREVVELSEGHGHYLESIGYVERVDDDVQDNIEEESILDTAEPVLEGVQSGLRGGSWRGDGGDYGDSEE